MALALASVLFTGAIFGFFYAWVCSTMWGLDATDPKIAIAAMQAMNASVRNVVFAPIFFGTPLVLLAAAVGNWHIRPAAYVFLAGGAIYLLGGLILTMIVNVPMNEALAQIVIPQDRQHATAIWAEYSGRWQMWNQIRTVASGVALLLAAWGTWRVGVA